MRGSVQIVRVAGIPVRLHWSMLALPLLAIGPGLSRLASSACFLAALFASVLAHELGHSLYARRRGLEVREIVLLPFGGISVIPRLEGSASDEMAVALVGPLTSCALALGLAALAWASGIALWPPTLLGRSLLARLAWANLLLGAFNLVPALPLDGGRVLRGLLARSADRVSATARAARVARALALVMILGGLLLDLWVALLGVVVLLAAGAEEHGAALSVACTGVRVRDVMVEDGHGLGADEPVAQVASFLGAFPGRSFPVVEGGRVVGIVCSADLGRAGPGATLADVADAGAPVLDAGAELFPDAVDQLLRSRRRALPVVSEGKLAGVLYRADVEAALRRLAQG